MSEPTAPAPEAPTTTEPDPQSTTQGDPADEPLREPGKKALEAERAARTAAEKAAAEYKAKLDEIEQANLSEVEKAQKAAQDAQDRLAEVTRQNTINSVALAKGVPADLVEFLSGDTEEQVAARADALMSRLNAPKTPQPDPSQGSKGATALNSDALERALRDKLGA